MIKYFYLNNRWDPAGTTTLGQSGPGSNGNEEVVHIPPDFEPLSYLVPNSVYIRFVNK